jgi:hypothetical protein
MALTHISAAHNLNDTLFIQGAVNQPTNRRTVPAQPAPKPRLFRIAIESVIDLQLSDLFRSFIRKGTTLSLAGILFD